MTKEEAIELSKTRFWEKMTPREIALFQFFEERLCMPFEVFHEAMESALGRPVCVHEFALNFGGLEVELLGDSQEKTLIEIIDITGKVWHGQK